MTYPKRHLQRWTRSEDRSLLLLVRRRETSFENIVAQHERTPEAIRQRLIRLAIAGGINNMDLGLTPGVSVMYAIQMQHNGFTDRVLDKIYGACARNPDLIYVAVTPRKEKKVTPTKFYNVVSHGNTPTDTAPMDKDVAIDRAKSLAIQYPLTAFFVTEAIESYSMGNPLKRVLKAAPKPRVKKAV